MILSIFGSKMGFMGTISLTPKRCYRKLFGKVLKTLDTLLLYIVSLPEKHFYPASVNTCEILNWQRKFLLRPTEKFEL